MLYFLLLYIYFIGVGSRSSNERKVLRPLLLMISSAVAAPDNSIFKMPLHSHAFPYKQKVGRPYGICTLQHDPL